MIPAWWNGIRARLAREHTLLVSLGVLYFIGARLGLLCAYQSPAVSVVWPPAGVVLGAFLILGYRIWPFVFTAGVVVYTVALGFTPAALLLAASATAEGTLAAYLVNRYASGRHALHNPRNSLRFVGVVLIASLICHATIATVSLAATRHISWFDYSVTWTSLALGNFVGILLVAPSLILFRQGSIGRLRPAQVLEGGAVMLTVALVGALVFGGLPIGMEGYPIEFLAVPVLLWASFRLGRRAAVGALAVLTTIAIIGTLQGYGPFVRATPTASLVIVQLFVAITAVMTLALSAVASEYSMAEAQLRELVVTDPLTGLPNYRKLLTVLGHEIARADRTDRPFAVVFFDMDGLKRINDEMGHLVGSRAVCRFADTLRTACRTTDTPARYGGDEFVAVLSDTDLDGARLVVDRIEARLEDDTDPPLLSVSAGIAVYPRDGGTPTTLLSAADRALYSVKADKVTARRRTSVAGLRERPGA
jgi:diguanylate cyclase (GGDEF)-like protein